MIAAETGPFSWRPTIKWNGGENQFHSWFSNLFRLDFGYSMKDGRKARKKILEALSWTVWLNLVAGILAVVLGLFIGTKLALNPEKRRSSLISGILYFFYAIPIFWLATLLIVFFTTSTYGEWTNIFPSIASFLIFDEGPVVIKFFNQIGYFILPLFCLVMPSLAFIAKQMKESVRNELSKHYARMMALQGFSDQQLFRKHVLKNAMFPMITMLSSVIPFIFGGSLIIEVIFNIPGMGRLMFQSILGQDWNVVFAMLLLSALITMLSYLLMDILYASLNPKVNLNEDR